LLSLRRRVVFFQRHWARACILRYLKALRGELFAPARQGEVIVVAGHALDFDQLLATHVFEDGIDHLNRQAERPAEAMEARTAFKQQRAKDKTEHQIL